VAMFGALLTRRSLYHSNMYSQMVDQSSAAFQNIAGNVRVFVHQGSGMNTADVTAATKILIGSHVAQQAFVKAVCDDFFIAAAITAVGFIPVLFLKTKNL